MKYDLTESGNNLTKMSEVGEEVGESHITQRVVPDVSADVSPSTVLRDNFRDLCEDEDDYETLKIRLKEHMKDILASDIQVVNVKIFITSFYMVS